MYVYYVLRGTGMWSLHRNLIWGYNTLNILGILRLQPMPKALKVAGHPHHKIQSIVSQNLQGAALCRRTRCNMYVCVQIRRLWLQISYVQFATEKNKSPTGGGSDVPGLSFDCNMLQRQRRCMSSIQRHTYRHKENEKIQECYKGKQGIAAGRFGHRLRENC